MREKERKITRERESYSGREKRHRDVDRGRYIHKEGQVRRKTTKGVDTETGAVRDTYRDANI